MSGRRLPSRQLHRYNYQKKYVQLIGDHSSYWGPMDVLNELPNEKLYQAVAD